MKKLMTMSAILAMAMGLTLTACSSDDDNDNNSTQEENAAEVARIQEQMQADLMMKALCEYDSTTATYTSRIGEAINAPTPTIYYAIANTVEQARSRYEDIVSFLRTETSESTKTADPDVASEPLPTDVTRGDIHVSFAASSAAGEVARINVDCPRLANVLTAIVFIPEEAWPENADVVAPFNYMSCWREKSTGRIYICTQECKGGKGIMLTLDGGWEEDWFKKYDYWQGEFYLWKETASYDAFRGLSDAYKYSPDRLNFMNNALQKSYPSTTTAGYMRNFVEYGSTYIFDCDFDYDYSYDHHLWRFYNCWDVTIKRLYFNPYTHDVKTHNTDYTHKQVPQRTNPSHEFTFDRGDKRDDNVWEAIYR